MVEQKTQVEKSRIIALVLLFAVGYTGVHNFYLGRKKVAVTQLAMLVADAVSVMLTFGIAMFAALHRTNVTSSILMVFFPSLVLGLSFTLFVWAIVDFFWIVFSKKNWLTWKVK
jgi:TM2 domain-containing membrane protein YozV